SAREPADSCERRGGRHAHGFGGGPEGGGTNGAPGTGLWQAVMGRRKGGWSGATPFLLPSASAPPAFGSGNFGTPCERMHRANFSICCCSFACSAAVCRPPLGRSLSHAFRARSNWGEWTSTPVFWPLAETPEVILIRPSLSGSGKFGTPCERMHA